MLYRIFIPLWLMVLSCNMTQKNKTLPTSTQDCRFEQLNSNLKPKKLVSEECVEFAKMVQEKLLVCNCNNQFYNDTVFWNNVYKNQSCLDNYQNSDILRFFRLSDSTSYYEFPVTDSCSNKLVRSKYSYLIKLYKDSLKIGKRIHSTKLYYD